MFDQLIGVIVIWAMTIVSNMERLFSNDTINIPSRKIAKRTIGILIVILSTLGLLVQAYISLNKANQARLLQQVVIDTNSILFNEASGGAAIEDVAYIVDDEKPRLFKLRLVDDVYHFVEEIKLTEKGQVLSAEDVSDLESAAVRPGAQFNGRIYLLTSHSNTRKGADKKERQRFLEVSLESDTRGEITRSVTGLREQMLAEFKKLGVEPFKNKDGAIENMQIEGLAIDEEGFAYLGFRAPLAEQKYALVFRARLEDIFQNQAQWKSFRLNLSHEGMIYSMASIDYDAQTRTMLLLGSSPDHTDYVQPVLWQWNFLGAARDDPLQNPKKLGVIQFSTKPVIGRPELILLPPATLSDRVFMFLDTDDRGEGGQISIQRRDYALESGRASGQ